MKVATFNAASVRARLDGIIEWLAVNEPDVLCIQETKVEDDKFPREEFERLGNRLREQSLTDSRTRKLRRWLFSQAHAAEPDRQRRIVVPQWLREVASIDDKVLIAGMDNYLELWNPESWRNQDQALRAELDDADFFASLNV